MSDGRILKEGCRKPVLGVRCWKSTHADSTRKRPLGFSVTPQSTVVYNKCRSWAQKQLRDIIVFNMFILTRILWAARFASRSSYRFFLMTWQSPLAKFHFVNFSQARQLCKAATSARAALAIQSYFEVANKAILGVSWMSKSGDNGRSRRIRLLWDVLAVAANEVRAFLGNKLWIVGRGKLFRGFCKRVAGFAIGQEKARVSLFTPWNMWVPNKILAAACYTKSQQKKRVCRALIFIRFFRFIKSRSLISLFYWFSFSNCTEVRFKGRNSLFGQVPFSQYVWEPQGASLILSYIGSLPNFSSHSSLVEAWKFVCFSDD